MQLFAALKKRIAEESSCQKAVKEWNRQFPALSLHPPYVSAEERIELEKYLRKQRARIEESCEKSP